MVESNKYISKCKVQGVPRQSVTLYTVFSVSYKDIYYLWFSVVHTAHWGKSQPQLSSAAIWGRFFESLKHGKQILSIIEFENQV